MGIPWGVTAHICIGDDHYPVCRLDIREDSEFATGYGYPKSALKRESDTDIRNAFIDISKDSDFWKKLHIAQSFIYYLHSEVSFQPSVP